jgi:tRNA pseudouridine55 synthase
MDGVLVIDKPAGFTSHDVVAKVRKILGERQIGHTGTLDPSATGVLPLVVGKATKLARYLSGADKAYTATVVLGVGTTTLDAEGVVTAQKEVLCTAEQVHEVLKGFVGEIEQIPPMYSAKKIKGQKLYELARKGEEIEREPKKVRIYAVSHVEVALPEVSFEVSCSSGTYIRVLAEDMGARLGLPAHLKSLKRTRAGVFELKQAVSLEVLETNPSQSLAHVVSMADALAHLPRLNMPESLAKKVLQGYQLLAADLLTLDVPTFSQDDAVALAVEGGGVCAVARAQVASDALFDVRRDAKGLKTERVL